MPCLIGCFALLMPRVAIVLVVLFSDYLGNAYATVIWPLLGFIFLPTTTLAYAFAWHSGGGHVSGFGLFIVIVAVLIDLGMIGGGRYSHHRWRERDGAR